MFVQQFPYVKFITAFKFLYIHINGISPENIICLPIQIIKHKQHLLNAIHKNVLFFGKSVYFSTGFLQ